MKDSTKLLLFLRKLGQTFHPYYPTLFFFPFFFLLNSSNKTKIHEHVLEMFNFNLKTSI
jgi:hypothetical protein